METSPWQESIAVLASDVIWLVHGVDYLIGMPRTTD